MNNTDQNKVTIQRLTSEELELVNGGIISIWVAKKVVSGAKKATKYASKKFWESKYGKQLFR